MALAYDIERHPSLEALESDPHRRALLRLLSDYSTETTPGHARRIADYRALLDTGRQVNVTFLPGSDFADTIATAKRLKAEGFRPVPHVAARAIPSTTALHDMLAKLQDEAGVDEVLAIAGGTDRPAGPFSGSMDMLETGLFERHGIRRIAVAGHPEGSPDISDRALAEALARKNAYAADTGSTLYLTTQFCFEAAPVIDWSRRLADEGNLLPIRIGIPGPATVKALANYARLCGIGPSARILKRQMRNITKLMTVSAPVRLVTELALHTAAQPGSQIAGVHVFPLGGLEPMSRWLDSILAGQFEMHPDLRGFSLRKPALRG